jgi:hypothetical protein
MAAIRKAIKFSSSNVTHSKSLQWSGNHKVLDPVLTDQPAAAELGCQAPGNIGVHTVPQTA